MAKKASTSSKPSGDRRTSREVDATDAAIGELAGLMIACRRNNGIRTCHVLMVPDEKCLDLLKRLATCRGFEFDAKLDGGGETAISVWRK